MDRIVRHMFTRADYEATPDDWRGELIVGELVMTPPPIPYHQYLLTELPTRIRDHLGPDQAWRVLPAPVDVHVDDHNVYQPDLLVLPEGGERPHLAWKIPMPMWVAEILSPRTARYDEEIKLPRLAEAGVLEAWFLAPRARTITVHDLTRFTRETHSGDAEAPSITLHGFRLAPDELFA